MLLKELRSGDRRWEVALLSGPNTTAQLGPLDDLEAGLRRIADSLGISVHHMQSNHEGALLEYVHAMAPRVDAFMVNPGGLVRTGESLRHCLKDAKRPAVELHLDQRDLRGASIFAPSVTGHFAGLGHAAFVGALVALTLALDDIDFLNPQGTSEINRSHGSPRSLYS